MTIFITSQEFLDYHGRLDVSKEKAHIHSLVDRRQHSVLDFPFERSSNGHGEIDIHRLELDTETLEHQLAQNRQEILNNHSIQEFINRQRIHKANFLKEIKEKGLTRKSNPEDQNERIILNY